MSIRLLLSLFSLLWSPPQVRIPGPGGASAGSSYSYLHEYTLTLGSSAQIPATQANFTVLVCANTTLGNGSACPTQTGLKVTGSGGYVTSSSGYDIAFSSTACASPTPMGWSMPTYTGSTGAMEAWVRVTSLAAGGTFYVCVGNASITTFQGGGSSAWDNNTAGVWHLPNGSTLSASDDSSNGNNGNIHSTPAGSGQIDGAASFSNTSSQYISIPDAASLELTSQVTVSAWVNVTAGTNYPMIGAKLTDGGSTGYGLYLNTSGTYFEAQVNSTSLESTTALGTGSWKHIAMTYNGSMLALYLNGALNTSTSLTGAITTNTNFFGIGTDASLNDFFSGLIDEVHVAGTARSANWLLTEYNNQSAPASFMAIVLTY